jgi:hypothetical protein
LEGGQILRALSPPGWLVELVLAAFFAGDSRNTRRRWRYLELHFHNLCISYLRSFMFNSRKLHPDTIIEVAIYALHGISLILVNGEFQRQNCQIMR